MRFATPDEKTRYRLGLYGSIVLLSVVVLVWRDLFIFSKVFRLPDWAASLPTPMHAPAYLVGLSLLPAILLPSGLTHSVKASCISAALGPIPGLIPSGMGINFAMNYLWIVVFHFAVPLAILITFRAMVAFFGTLCKRS